ncbi:MAG: beta-phosphoglucomutase family hydrolase [Pirellulales bacterium]|nr:beta-phosphoglucomutase family hydrolase [Pirellulales bacterium]
MKASLAVIFDMDGVLVDSYHAHFLSFQHLAAEEGLALTEAHFAQVFGWTSRKIFAHLWGEGRYSDDEIAALDAKKEAYYRTLIERDFPAMPGARETLETLHAAGFRLAVGSSGPPENVEMVLDRLEVRPWFGAIVTGRDVIRGKPDPQVFLLAAERLGVPPPHCAVVEDAPAGIAAARAAGMAAIGFLSTGRTRQELAAAACSVHSFGELSPDLFYRFLPMPCRL